MKTKLKIQLARFLLKFFVKEYDDIVPPGNEERVINKGPFKFIIQVAATGEWGTRYDGQKANIIQFFNINQIVVPTGDMAWEFTFGKYKVAVLLRNPEKW